MSRSISQSAYTALKKRVFERDNFLCVVCQRPASDLHHVIFRSAGGADDIENCIALCRECHEKYGHGTEEKKWRKEFQEYLKGANK